MGADDGALNGVAALLARAGASWPDRIGVQETASGAALTWAELDAAANAQARRLTKAGVSAGDRVALRLPTSADFAVSFFAAMRAGAIAVPISPLAPLPEIAGLLEHSGAKIVIQRESRLRVTRPTRGT